MQKAEKKIFAVIGGDSRQARLCGLLAQDGHRVRTCALERCSLPAGVQQEDTARAACAGADCVVLPMPLSRERGILNAPLSREGCAVADVFAVIEAGTLVCAGSVSDEAKQLAQAQGLRLVDYFEREELKIANAVPTAEGAIQIAMEEMPITLNGSRCLVVGCGRIGRLLAPLLRALGADVAVSARKPADLALIRAMGCRALVTGTLEYELQGFDAVFNTVPFLVLGKPQLRRIREDAVVIDLASRPGGVDFAYASELGLQVHWALSLPGKVAPLTSAKIIRDTICAVLEEEKG